MGDATLEALGAHCGELRGLKLWAVEEVTCAGVRALARGCHRLEAVDLRACEELDKSMARCGEGCLVALAESAPPPNFLVMRFTIVLLPTLGRPTTAIV